MTDVRPFVSVIVPVLDPGGDLPRCLAALRAQTWPRDRYEVIVVDNGSRDDIAAEAADGGAAFQGISAEGHPRVVREPTPGSYAARNRGLAEARGEIVAFTDVDCVPARDWIDRGVAQLAASPDCGFVAGRVELSVHDERRPTASELYDRTVMNFHQDRNVAERRFGATANLFAFRRVFDAVGTFDARLMSGGDLEWGRRVAARGLAQLYAADARVTHAARRSLDATWARARRLTGGTYALRVAGGYPAWRRAVDLLRAFTPALGFYARLLAGPDPPRVADRLRVVLVALGVKYVGAAELLRLTLGGTPRRA